MKNKQRDMVPILLLGVLANVLLNVQAGYWTQTGFITALAAVPLLTVVVWLFARLWERMEKPLITSIFFVAILIGGGVLELLRLNTLYETAYPGGTTFVGICLAVLLPTIYLRRKAALIQTANIVLALIVLGWLFLVFSVHTRLNLSNLQYTIANRENWNMAWKAQFTLYPEYFLAALWTQNAKKKFCPAKIPFWAVYGGLAGNLIIELLFGASALQTGHTLHAAARYGAVSVFTRLEWVQMILWTMAVTTKVALYLYAAVQLAARISKPTRKEEHILSWKNFPIVLGGLLLGAALLKPLSLTTLFTAQTMALWLLLACALAERGLQCLLNLRKAD